MGVQLLPHESLSQMLAQNCLLSMYLTAQLKADRMTVDVHGNPLSSMGFGYMYHELHHTKHHQRRSAPQYSQTRPKATGQTSCCLWLIPTMQCHLRLQKDSFHPPGNSRQTFQSWHTEEGIQTQVCFRTNPQKW